ncbi:MarR family winged helix-turn-helix transcriptional regulator [Ramlibacter rhizophilus]|uniref:MarR family transcriptional regulator n=1 Tax=Ramlibacter rhizophilus TaxID=1781167 RepID=A0A4Z0BKJ7_9BURK|nr:MarR family winged helix-turn-helix transcriptional regulator [Ramlibacter rhizophilus]TFY98614.1 MarR family transcriptional regulator [Ramlibacter rhizophilus]
MSRHPLTPLYDMPAHLIRRAHQQVTQVFEREMGYLGITASQLGVLIAAHLQPGLQQRELAGTLHFDEATLGGMVGRLEVQGYIERRSSSRSTRGREIYLTAEGRRLYAKIEPHVRNIQRELLARLSAREQKEFLRLLSKLIDAENSHHPATVPHDKETS